MKWTVNLPNYQEENTDTLRKRRHIAVDKGSKRSSEDTEKNEVNR